MTTSLVSIDPELFRAYDIRGRTDRSLGEREAELIGRAIGSEIRERGGEAVVVGRDGRLASRDLTRALIRGLVGCGCEVHYAGMVPTPVVRFAGFRLGIGNTVMVTGSHNPPEYNGFKIALDHRSLHGEEIQDLFRRIRKNRFVRGRGESRRVAVIDDYLEALRQRISPGRHLRIGLDCGHGVTAVLARRVFAELGCEVHTLNCRVDGAFPAHPPDPAPPEHLAELGRMVRRRGLDLGLAFDGDGDRLGAVDEHGAPVAADLLLALFAVELLARRPHAAIVHDIKCSGLVPETIRRLNGHPVSSRSGHSLLAVRLREEGALLAGEYSGHLFFADRWFGFDDGLYAGARLVELVSLSNEPLSAWLAQLPRRVSTPELLVPFDHHAEALAFVQRFIDRFDRSGTEEVLTLDGLRVEYPFGWFLVRASNTMPAVTLRMEARDEQGLALLRRKLADALRAADPHIEIPWRD